MDNRHVSLLDDVKMGKQAGAISVGVLSGVGLREDLKEADHIIERYLARFFEFPCSLGVL